jgi:dnd system-associated protein 4
LFKNPTPTHVIQTENRRKTSGSAQIYFSGNVIIKTDNQQKYELMKEPVKRRATIGTKRIQRASDKESIITLLTSESVGAFRENWRVVFFAALIGYKNGRRDPLGSVQTGEGIRQDSFANNPVWHGMLYLLGLVETNSTDVLQSTEEAENERIKIFEEYANGGLAILKEHFASSNESLDSLLTFIQSQTSTAKPPDLSITI